MSDFNIKFNKNIKNLRQYSITILKKNIKRLNSNESDKPIFPDEILLKNIDNLNYYPEEKYEILAKKSANFYNVKENQVIPVNGSDEGIDLIIRTFCNNNDKVLVLNPGFVMYSHYATAFGVKTISLELTEEANSFTLNIDNFIKIAKIEKPKIVFISNPLANVGSYINERELTKIVKTLQNSIVVIDEAYIDFTERNSFLAQLDKYKNLIILRTMSKFFGLAGIRLGYIFTNFKNEILKIKSPYNVNQITCQIGINLFENIQKEDIITRKQDFLQKKINLINWLKKFEEVDKIFNSETNFVFVKLKCKSNIFADKLLKKYKIKIKTMSEKFENYCRISTL